MRPEGRADHLRQRTGFDRTGCRRHDACYDCCTATFGCEWWNLFAAECRHANVIPGVNRCTADRAPSCDIECLVNYGISVCGDWSNGGGESDGALTFDLRELGREPSCACNDSCNDAG